MRTVLVGLVLFPDFLVIFSLRIVVFISVCVVVIVRAAFPIRFIFSGPFSLRFFLHNSFIIDRILTDTLCNRENIS